MDANNKQQFENFNPLSKKNIIENFLLEINQLLIDDQELNLDSKDKLEKKLDKFLLDESLSAEIKLELIRIKKLFEILDDI